MGSTSINSLDLDDVAIRPLDSCYSRAAFCCGNQRIDNFFRNNVRDQHDRHKIRAYIAIYKNQPIGYYYLVAKSDEPEKISIEAQEKFGRVKSAPCVYLGMLGVSKTYQNCGLGKILMLHAMKQTLLIANLVGIYALTLDAIDESTAKRYERWNFSRFIDGGLSMYIPLTTIKNLFPEKL